MEFLSSWFQRNFSNPQVVLLALVLVAGLLESYSSDRSSRP